MNVSVTDEGVLIPKEMLEGVREVKILNKGSVLTLYYDDITDASVNLDK